MESEIFILIEIIIIMTIYCLNERKKNLKGLLEKMYIRVPKGTKKSLRAYAELRGYKNENDYISSLVQKDIEELNKKINK